MPTANNNNTNHKTSEKRKIRAVVRIRPLLDVETQSSDQCLSAQPPDTILCNDYQKKNRKKFKFDKIYDIQSTQTDIFEAEVSPLIEHVFDGKNCTLLCYGPTGSGKTWTAFGMDHSLGIIPRAAEMMMHKLKQSQQTSTPPPTISLKLAMLEVYNEKLYDLLNDTAPQTTALQVLEQANKKLKIPGLTLKTIDSFNTFHALLTAAIKRRKHASTLLNSHSSRSHAIISLHVQQTFAHTQYHGKLCITDLAGSENNKRTGNDGDKIRLTESGNINKSLLALGSVIDALNRGETPRYRESVLTRLLADSLGGHSISTIVCCVNGKKEEAITMRRCLERGAKSRTIENNITVNVETKTAPEKENLHKRKRQRKTAAKDGDDRHRVRKKRKTQSKPSLKFQQLQNTNISATSASSNNISLLSLATENDNDDRIDDHIDDDDDEDGDDDDERKRGSPVRKPKSFSQAPTPSRYITGDEYQKKTHRQMLDQIDELTQLDKQRHLEQQQLQQCLQNLENRMELVANDQFGLPPVSNPESANANIALSIIEYARKLEKEQQLKVALVQYQRALDLIPTHKGLRKKVEKLQLKLESAKVVRALQFDKQEDATAAPPVPPVNNNPDDHCDEKKKNATQNQINTKQQQLPRKKKKLRRKTVTEFVEIASSPEIDDREHDQNTRKKDIHQVQPKPKDEDEDEEMEDCTDFIEKLLSFVNKASEKELSAMQHIGPARIKQILELRPFGNIQGLRKVKGFQTKNGWNKFISSNKDCYFLTI